jgi:hypothetical protein
MEKKYRDLIDALHGEDDRIEVAATVAYRDGSVGQLKSAVLPNTLRAAGLREGVA